MTKKETEKTKTEEAKEAKRKVALLNLNAKHLMNLANAYHVENGNYGEAGSSAVDQFIYQPAISGGTNFYSENGEQVNLVISSLLGSRADGKRYTGNVKEYDIIKQAAMIQQESLIGIKISDATNILGISYEGDKANKYLGELLQSEDDEDKKLAQQILGTYLGNSADNTVSDALTQRVKSRTSGLEKILKPSEKSE